jgi:hypothetical protein
MDRVYVISNYDYDPSDVISSLNGNYILYQQGDDTKVPKKIKKLDNFRISPHTGHNISDYLSYIIDNYDNLPKEIGFIKGSIYPRHITKELFESRINETGFIPLYSDENTYKTNIQGRICKKLIAQQISPGLYMEIANDWYVSSSEKGRYYPTLESLFYKITGRDLPMYITMVPGACMVVERNKVLKWDKIFYEELYKSITYRYFPVEAYHMERCMCYIFNYLKK